MVKKTHTFDDTLDELAMLSELKNGTWDELAELRSTLYQCVGKLQRIKRDIIGRGHERTFRRKNFHFDGIRKAVAELRRGLPKT